MDEYARTSSGPFNDTFPGFNEPGYCLPVTYQEFLYSLEESVLGQEEALKGIAYDIYSYLRGVTRGNPVKHNFILAGPSASGKTELYRTVKKLSGKYACPVPVLHLDISDFTPTGFQGGEISVIPEMIRNEGSDGAAVVFLDEFDKILVPLYGSNGDNVNKVLQHELLTLIEGRVCNVRQNNRLCPVNTGRTLFIAMGAFMEYREGADRKKQKKPIGFASGEGVPAEGTDILEMKNLRQVGGVAELLGRFDNVYNFRPIGKDIFESLFGHFIEELSIEQEILIRATRGAVREFFSLAESEYGCREIRRTLYNTIKPCLIKMADEEERLKYCILVRGISKAVLEARKVPSGFRR